MNSITVTKIRNNIICFKSGSWIVSVVYNTDTNIFCEGIIVKIVIPYKNTFNMYKTNTISPQKRAGGGDI